MRISTKFDVSCFLTIVVLVCVSAAQAQSSCGIQHREPGTYICFPDASRTLPASFHLSAQGNAAADQKITGYQVAIDNQVVYQEVAPNPVRELAIETTVKGPPTDGPHTLRLTITGAGSAEVSGLRFAAARNEIGPCDPLSKSPNWVCLAAGSRGELKSPFDVHPAPLESKDLRSGFLAYRDIYQRNWKNLEFGTAEAFALDQAGNIYVASHSFADITVRKYDPLGSRLLYSDVVRACGEGFTTISALVVDDGGHAWVSGYTNACLPTTSSAYQKQITTGTSHGFVARLKTDGNEPPEFLTYVGGRSVTQIRVNGEGNILLAGSADSSSFPRSRSFALIPNGAGKNAGFIGMLDPTGSKLIWSTLLQGAAVNALAIDRSGDIYATGESAGRHAFVAKLAQNGERLIYSRAFGGNGVDRGREIAVDQENGRIYVTGETDSSDFSAATKPHAGSSAVSHRPGTPAEFLLELTAEGRLIRSANIDGSDTVLAPTRGPVLDAFVAGRTSGTKSNQK